MSEQQRDDGRGGRADPIRRRFFINGKSAAAQALHDRYQIPANKLLGSLAELGLPAREQRFVHGPVLVDEHEEGDEIVRTFVTGALVRAKAGPVPEVHIDVLTRTERSGGEQQREQTEPYLWVGARIAWERMPDYEQIFNDGALNLRDVCQLHVWEPGIHGILGTAPMMPIAQQFRFYGDDDIAAQEAAMAGVVPDDVRVAGVLDSDNPVSGGLSPVDFFLFWHTQHMMYLTSWGYSLQPALDSESSTSPNYNARLIYDPLEGEDQWTTRFIPPPEDYDSEGDGQGNVISEWPLWDSVVVLDPDLGGAAPTDGRGLLPIKEVAAQAGIALGRSQVLPGTYTIKLAAKGWACPAQSFEMDLEVRVRKHPHMVRERFEVTVPNLGYVARCIKPYGWYHPPQWDNYCAIDSGPNPHEQNWWPGAVLVDPVQGSIARTPDGEAHVPEHGFEPGSYPFCSFPDNDPVGEVLYIAFAYPSSAPWKDHAAEVMGRIVAYDRRWGNASDYPFDDYLAGFGSPPFFGAPGSGTSFGTVVRDAAQLAIDAMAPALAPYGLWRWDQEALRFVTVVPVGPLLDGSDPPAWFVPFAAADNALGKTAYYWTVGWGSGISYPPDKQSCFHA